MVLGSALQLCLLSSKQRCIRIVSSESVKIFAQRGVQAIDDTPPSAHWTLGCLLPVLPTVTASLHFCPVSLQRVSWSSSVLCLHIAGQSLSGDVAGSLPNDVADPAPLSSRGLWGNRFVVSPFYRSPVTIICGLRIQRASIHQRTSVGATCGVMVSTSAFLTYHQC